MLELRWMVLDMHDSRSNDSRLSLEQDPQARDRQKSEYQGPFQAVQALDSEASLCVAFHHSVTVN